MNTLIISGGKKIDISIANEYIKKADYIICVDKGLEYANKHNIIPKLIVGDMDSVNRSLLSEYKKDTIIIYPKEKNFTDTNMAIKKAVELGANNIVLINATGSRLDHTLSNIKLLLELKDKGIDTKIVDDNNIIFLVNKYVKIKKIEDQVISIIPLDDCYKVKISGFKYSLNEEKIGLDWNIGISNKISLEYGEIKLQKGNLLIVISKESE